MRFIFVHKKTEILLSTTCKIHPSAHSTFCTPLIILQHLPDPLPSVRLVSSFDVFFSLTNEIMPRGEVHIFPRNELYELLNFILLIFYLHVLTPQKSFFGIYGAHPTALRTFLWYLAYSHGGIFHQKLLSLQKQVLILQKL